MEASDQEVVDAANAADIHERILSFTRRKLNFYAWVKLHIQSKNILLRNTMKEKIFLIF